MRPNIFFNSKNGGEIYQHLLKTNTEIKAKAPQKITTTDKRIQTDRHYENKSIHKSNHSKAPTY